MSLPAWPRHGPCKPSNCARFTLNRHWGKPATGRSLASMRAQSLWSCPTLHLCGLWPARLLCQGGEFSRQEYWSVLANAGCHTLLEHYTSYSPSCHYPPPSPWCCQNPWDPSSRTPPHLVLTGADPSPPGQPQEQTPVDDPHAEVEIKSQLKPRGRVTKEEDPKPSHQMYKLQIKFTGSTRQTLCLWNIWEDSESTHKGKCTSSDSCGHWRQGHTGVGPE